jgi:hypothetical protein
MNVLDEDSLRFQEAFIPELAEGAIKQAYYQTLAAGCVVLEVADGQLIESSPDGSCRVLKSLPKPIPVSPGQRLLRLKK